MGYKSNWKCYHCLETDNLIDINMYCKHCRKGINPFYFFLKNKRKFYDIKSCYKVLTKEYGLIQGCDNLQTSQLVCDMTMFYFFVFA